MINKRLIHVVEDSKKYIAYNVFFQWCSLIANIVMMVIIAKVLAMAYQGEVETTKVVTLAIVAVVALLIRFVMTIAASRMSYLSAKMVKKTLREKIYEKLLRIGVSYNESIKTSEVVQVAVEGVDQLETYFGAYLPQFFYAMLAPLTLFLTLSFVNLPSAIVLLVCVPMIPVAIMAVQTWAKKLLSKYWGQYTTLGDTFLENLQGLTTLKIYQSDEFKSKEMVEESEKFRKITMKVLTMQLNSITIMDLIAYGGAALGVIMSVTQFQAGKVTFFGAVLIVLLSADFFLPMRLLGSYFHIAMNGMAASEKIFRLLDMPEQEEKKEQIGEDKTISCEGLCFSYEADREILKKIDFHIPKGNFVAIAGESGCGKSTIASLITGKNKAYTGSLQIGGKELRELSEESLMKNITYISHKSYLFKGTVRENLLMGNPQATEEMMWQALKNVKLYDFFKEQKGLETLLSEKASNLSGGQCQRLALARALLHNSPIYIFDEATSNIDVESENDIMGEIYRLAKEKTVLVISHRLANIVNADNIYVMEDGKIKEQGSHRELCEQRGVYWELWQAQQSLENYGKESDIA